MTTWLNEKNFTIGRVTKSYMGHLFYQMDINYKRVDPHGFLPMTWKETAWTNDNESRIRVASVSEVTEYRVNEPLNDGDFSSEFPRDTQVLSQKRRTGDGSESVESALPPPQQSSGWLSWIDVMPVLLLIGIGLIIAFVVYSYKRLTPNKS